MSQSNINLLNRRKINSDEGFAILQETMRYVIAETTKLFDEVENRDNEANVLLEPENLETLFRVLHEINEVNKLKNSYYLSEINSDFEQELVLNYNKSAVEALNFSMYPGGISYGIQDSIKNSPDGMIVPVFFLFADNFKTFSMKDTVLVVKVINRIFDSLEVIYEKYEIDTSHLYIGIVGMSFGHSKTVIVRERRDENKWSFKESSDIENESLPLGDLISRHS